MNMFSASHIICQYNAGRLVRHVGTRTSKLCSRLHVESDNDLRSSVSGRESGAHWGYSQTARTPTRGLDTCARGTGRQNGCIAPCKVGRAEGCTSVLVILFGKFPIRRCVFGDNLDESICERFDRACELRIFRTGRRIGAGSDGSGELLEESK